MLNLNQELEKYEFSYYFFGKDGNSEEFKGESKYFSELLNNISFDMVYLPDGVFSMGSPENESERFNNEGPVHKVEVEPFFVGKYPVTQNLWKNFWVIILHIFKVRIDLLKVSPGVMLIIFANFSAIQQV